jgi:syntaxin-binding protein 1
MSLRPRVGGAAAAAAPPEPARGIRGAMKERILSDMVDAVPGDFKILVCDKGGTQILSACLRMHELMDHGITLVEDLTKARQPIPSSPVLYFVAPTEANVQAIVKEWATKDIYKEAHIFFTSDSTDALVDLIASARIKDKVKSLKDMLMDFHAPETLQFHLGMLDELPTFFGGPRANDAAVQKLSRRLAFVAHTLGDMPVIRYQNTELCRSVAAAMSRFVDEIAADDKAMQTKEPRTIFFVLDRSVDLADPLLHHITYQAVLDDLMPLQDNIFKQKYKDRTGSDAERICVVDEADPFWCKYRHQPLPTCCDVIPAELRQLIADNPALVGAEKQGGTSLKDLGSAIRNLPEFQEKQAKLSMHVDICSLLVQAYQREKLADPRDVEQTIACGTGQSKQWLEAVKKACMALSSEESKMRLVLLFAALVASKDVSDAKKKQLLDDCGLGENAGALQGFSLLVSRGIARLPQPKGLKAEAGHDAYIPQVKLIVDTIDSLSRTDFPYLKDADAAAVGAGAAGPKKAGAGKTGLLGAKFSAGVGRSAAQNERQLELGGGEKVALQNQQRVVLFIIGGVTKNETRMAYEASRQLRREVIIGGTSVLSAAKLIRQLDGLSA